MASPEVAGVTSAPPASTRAGSTRPIHLTGTGPDARFGTATVTFPPTCGTPTRPRSAAWAGSKRGGSGVPRHFERVLVDEHDVVGQQRPAGCREPEAHRRLACTAVAEQQHRPPAHDRRRCVQPVPAEAPDGEEHQRPEAGVHGTVSKVVGADPDPPAAFGQVDPPADPGLGPEVDGVAASPQRRRATDLTKGLADGGRRRSRDELERDGDVSVGRLGGVDTEPVVEGDRRRAAGGERAPDRTDAQAALGHVAPRS